MKLSVVAGATSQSVSVFIQNSSSTTGAGLTGLVYNTSGLTAYYTFGGANATATAITLATLAAVNSAYSSGGFKEVDATNMPGVYRLDLPNAALATSKGRSVLVYLQGATNMAPCVLEIELTGWDNQDAVRGGLTALPNANAGANGGLPTGDASGRVAVQVGTGTGQINSSGGKVPATLASTDVTGNVAADVQTIKTQAVTCAAGVTVLASVGTASTSTAQTGDSYARLGAPAGASVSADIASVKSDSSGLRTDYTTARAGYLDTLNGLVQAIWDKATSALTTVGSIGKLLVDNINATISSRSTYGGGDTSGTTTLLSRIPGTVQPQTGDAYARLGAPAGASVSADVAAVKTDTAAIKAKTDNIPASPAAVSDIPTTAAIADKVLGRNIAGSSDGGRTVKDALRFNRNKVVISGTTITVYAEDDTTVAWTGTVTSTPGADPITAVDPA